jgi:thiosulfate/3-mercaptopyruvate sulfurtransferase
MDPVTHLISAKDLAHSLHDVVVLDVRYELGGPDGREEYARGHVPGAHYVDLDTELAAPPGDGGRHPLPDPALVEATLRRCGIDDESSVVVLDGRESFAAARAWWVLRWLGLEDVRVLDGGYAAWLRANLPVSTEVPEEGDGTFTARPGRLPVLDADGAARLARTGLLLDSRAAARYRGEVEPIDPVAGHIPGAVSSPTTDWLAADGTFRTDLAEHWAEVVGDRESSDVGAYCGSGVTAAHQLLALAEIGVDATLYPGSWSEWIRDPARPIATGEERAGRSA